MVGSSAEFTSTNESNASDGWRREGAAHDGIQRLNFNNQSIVTSKGMGIHNYSYLFRFGH